MEAALERAPRLLMFLEANVSSFCLMEGCTYLLGWNLNTNFLNGFCELIWLDCAVVVKIEVLECLHQDGLLGLGALCLLRQFILQFSLETKVKRVRKGNRWRNEPAQTLICKDGTLQDLAAVLTLL